jgi:hypothetical protein
MLFENKSKLQQLDKIDDYIKNQFNIGFEFEFYLNKTNLEVIIKELYDLLKTSIVIPFKKGAFLKIEDGNIIKKLGNNVGVSEKDFFVLENVQSKHYSFKSSDKLFILTNDKSGGLDMFEFITGPLEYKKSMELLKNVSEYIEKNGYARHNSALHINISLKNENLGLPEISKLNVIKYSLLFNDELLKKHYKEKYLNYSVKSIKHFLPVTGFKYKESLDKININTDTIKNFLDFFIKEEVKTNDVNLDIKKYYQVNFSKLENNYIEFRGCIGDDYYKKTEYNKEIIDYYIQSLYHTLKYNNVFSETEKEDLKEIMEFNNILLQCVDDYEVFKKYFKNIKFLIDLKENEESAKIYWQNIKPILKPIIYSFFDSGLHREINKQPKTFYLNYDSDVSHLQLYGFDIQNLFMDDFSENKVFVDFIKCNIKNSTLLFSYLKDNKIENCIMAGCNILDSNKFFESKIQKCKYSGISEYTKTNITNLYENSNLFKLKISNLRNKKINEKDFDGFIFKGKLLNDCVLITTFIDFKQTKINKSSLVYYFDFEKNKMEKY